MTNDKRQYGSDTKEMDEKYLDNSVNVVSVADEEAGVEHDAVFGDLSSKGPNYRNVGWIGSVALMMKTQIGLGVLSIPAVFDALGMIPGVICLLIIAAITTWSDYMVGAFKLRHREMYGLDDAGFIMFGRAGREVLAIGFLLFQTTCAGSGMLSISIAFNALSVHGACTAIFVAVATIITICVSSVRTLGKISWLAWIGLICIVAAIFTLTIAVGVQDRPAAAPQTGPWLREVHIARNPPFTKAISSVSSLLFAYAGTPSFFPIASEMRDPRQFTKALLICQSGVTAIYITIGVVVYYYCGAYVSSPALGSAGILMKKVCYGMALPGLIMSSTLLTHLASKYVFVRILRGSKHLASNSFVHWASWLGCVCGCATFSYIISSAIPVFGGLVSLIGALLGPVVAMIPMGCMWLYDNYSSGKSNQTLKWRLLVGWNVFIILAGAFMMIAGTYGSVTDIINSLKVEGATAPWSCADNSGSV